MSVPKKLAVCVTAHFDPSRLTYLKTISDHFSQLAQETVVTVITNTDDPQQLAALREVLQGKGFEFRLLSVTGLDHPHLLPWSHFPVFQAQFEDPTITNFLYVEDDLLLTRESVLYWVTGRDQLRGRGLIPSFLRVERKLGDDRWYVTDTLQAHYRSLPSVEVSGDLHFVSLPTPYQGMYLLDRELMAEHLAGPSSHPEQHPGGWEAREKAAQGLTFSNVPAGFYARNVVPYLPMERRVDPRCLVHHLPNNYANSASVHGKVLLDELIDG